MAYSPILNVMVGAARKASRPIRRDFGEVENLQVSLKGPANFVTKSDKRTEQILHDELLRARPTYSFLMEEGGEVEGTDGQHTWIIDPIDGTTNFISAFLISPSRSALKEPAPSLRASFTTRSPMSCSPQKGAAAPI